MFYYYGAKSKIAHLYPEPKYGIIIEPFAGAGRYALRYPDREVLLIDANPRIMAIWEWLIHEATPDQIMNLPSFSAKEKVVHPDPVVRDYLAFMHNHGSAAPHLTAGNFCNWGPGARKKVADLLPRIRHWQTKLGDYTEVYPSVATWFIDPPYQKAGGHYPNHKIDYEKLAVWCRSRRGQVIVCEDASSTWLPFEPLVTCRGQRHTRTEGMCLMNNPTHDKEVLCSVS